MLKRRCRTVTSYEGFKGRSSRGVDTLPTPSCLDYRHLLCPEDDVVGISFPLIWKKQSCAQAPQFLGDCFPRKHDFRIQENALKLCCSVWTHHQACSRHPWDVISLISDELSPILHWTLYFDTRPFELPTRKFEADGD